MYQHDDFLQGLTPEEVLDYLRKSQSDDPTMTVEEVLQKHEKILDEWSERHLGAVVPDKNKFREVVSGETIKERPEIKRVLRKIESPKIKAVKVVEPQRLTRGDLEDIGRLMKLLKHTNTRVITPERIYDLRDEYDWDAFERELMRGNDYLKYTKKILNRGRLLSVSQGNYIGSKPPYGYDKTWVKDGKRECPTLTENKEQADIVRLIYDLYVNKNMGYQRICNYLDGMSIKPPKGEQWSPHSLKSLLSNVHYIGKVKWNWRKTITIVKDSEIIHTRPTSKIGEYLIYDGKHEGIIPEELFNAAQEKGGKNPRAKANKKIINPLAGLLFCRCGRAMVYRTYINHGKETSSPRLLCSNQSRCQTGSCLFEELIDRVCDILRECIEDFEIRIEENEGDSAKLHARLIQNLEKKLEDLKATELSQWKAQTHHDPAQRMPADVFKRLNEELLKEKAEVQEALCKAKEQMPEPINYRERIETFSKALEALKNPSVDAELKNKLLKACIERIDYTREKPQRIASKQERFYDKEQKKTRYRSPLNTGGNWTTPPIEIDVKLRV